MMCPEQVQHQQWHESSPLEQGSTARSDVDIDSPGCSSWQKYMPGMRYGVAVLGLLGCMVDYLVRFGLSVAIVAMANTTNSHNTSHQLPTGACPTAHNTTQEDGKEFNGGGDFDWSMEQQGVILGTFFWGYFITKTTGGRISELVGARETMAVSLALSGVLSLLCPLAAQIHPMALAAVRFMMGLMQGPSFPALYTVLASWAPPEELATMVTIALSGMSVGSLVVMSTSELIVENFGWKWVFYGGGILALLWTPLWLGFVTNNPKDHPCMTDHERDLLAHNPEIHLKRHVPWRRLLQCYRFLPCILTEFASSWVSNQTTTEGPVFLKNQIGLTMYEASIVLTVGQCCSWCGAFMFGRVSDTLTKREITSKLNTRRILHAAGMSIVVMGLWGIVWAGCIKYLVCTLLVLVMAGSSAALCSYTLAPMDLAPNFAGTLSGLLGIGNISGFLAPIITSQIVEKTGSWAWSLVLGGGLYLSTGLLYLATITTEVQDWNDYEEIPDGDSEHQHYV